jgi:hypothetical protein
VWQATLAGSCPLRRGARSRALAPLALALLAAACSTVSPEPPADLLIVGGRVYTVEPERPWAEAMAVRGDRIVKVGTEKEVRALKGPAMREYDAHGCVVLPGFNDGHSGWCNSAALKAAEITARTPQPPPSQGEIVKVKRTGEPTGALKEGAMGPMERVLPKPSYDRKIAALEKIDDARSRIWWLTFYDRMLFMCTTRPREREGPLGQTVSEAHTAGS